MIVRVYWTIWAIFAGITALLGVTGNLNALTWSAVGFFAFGLTFMGMIGVLPLMAAHPMENEPKAVKPLPTSAEVKSAIPAVLKSA